MWPELAKARDPSEPATLMAWHSVLTVFLAGGGRMWSWYRVSPPQLGLRSQGWVGALVPFFRVPDVFVYPSSLPQANLFGVLFLSDGRTEMDRQIRGPSSVMRVLRWLVVVKKKVESKGRIS